MPKSLSKTPAPKKDRIYGSDKNKVGSASSKASAKGIELNESILATLSQKAKDYNEIHPKNKVSVATLKAVMRRGMGAYSTSHRPTITGGAPNSRQAWGFARVNKFLKKKAGQQVKAAYVQDDDLMEKGGLIAPNGKKSNLTPEQYKLVRTSEFKAWFGDWENDPQNASKVVDENGEPLVVYHGTDAKFNVFDINRSKYGFFFTNSYDLALTYDKNVYQFFLNIRKPRKKDFKGANYDGDYQLKDYSIRNIGYDTKTFASISHPNLGYNGAIMKNVMDIGEGGWNENLKPSNIYVVFEPNQIKLADGTNKTFDMNNPDIRYADGGSVGQEITCVNCGWHWNTKDSEEYDKYICHKCGFDNRTFYDHELIGEFNKYKIYKSIKPIRQANEIIERLEYMESQNKMAQGGVTEFYKQYQDWYKNGVSDKMTIMVSVPNAFSKMSSDDNHVILDVFEKIDESVDGKKKLTELLEIADKNEIDVYLEPIPRHNKIKDEAKKEKITREYLISYYEKFGFELLPNGFMVRKHKNNKMEKGGQTISSTEKLISYLKENGIKKQGTESTATDGTKYRYDTYMSKGESAPNFLVSIFEKAAQENGNRYGTRFTYKDTYSVAYDRPKYKGVSNGVIIMTELVEGDNMEKGGYYKAGGEINPDDKNVKDYFSHGSGNVGGVLVGKRHSEGGIKAVNKSTNQPLEMEGGEVVITRNAVSDDTKREFEGKMMTNREILSKINESGGGVSFADGGDIPETIHTSGKEYKYGGKMMKDHEIVSSCGCKHSMADGGETKNEKIDKKIDKIIKEIQPFIKEEEELSEIISEGNWTWGDKKLEELQEKRQIVKNKGIDIIVNTLGIKEGQLYKYNKIDDWDTLFVEIKIINKNFIEFTRYKNSKKFVLEDRLDDTQLEKVYKLYSRNNLFDALDFLEMFRNLTLLKGDELVWEKNQYVLKSEKENKNKIEEKEKIDKKELAKDWMKYVKDNRGYFQIGQEYEDVIELSTRENASIASEEYSQKDFDYAKYIVKKVKEKYPNTKSRIYTIDEWVELELTFVPNNKMAQGGETDYQTEIKNHLFPKVEVQVEVEVEPEMELMLVNEHYITADDLGLSDGMPMLAVGTIVYSSGGNDQWEVVSFSDDGVNLVNKPKSPLQSKMEDKHLTFDELIKYFKDKAISIKNISTERELEPAIALVKNKLPQKSFAVGGFIDGDEDEDAKIMQSQFGKSNFR